MNRAIAMPRARPGCCQTRCANRAWLAAASVVSSASCAVVVCDRESRTRTPARTPTTRATAPATMNAPYVGEEGVTGGVGGSGSQPGGHEAWARFCRSCPVRPSATAGGATTDDSTEVPSALPSYRAVDWARRRRRRAGRALGQSSASEPAVIAIPARCEEHEGDRHPDVGRVLRGGGQREQCQPNEDETALRVF